MSIKCKTCNTNLLINKDVAICYKCETAHPIGFYDLDYEEIAWSERKTDFYSGENCDELRPYWNSYFDGDKESENHDSDIILNANMFPPGTKVIIKVPICPICNQSSELCECENFDWKSWEWGKYS